MVGGFAACGFTHAGVVTLDVAKVRTQAYGKAGKWPNGLLPSIQQIWKGEGFRGLTLGWSPTLWGYGAQGLFKFGLNEFFKDFYTKLVGEETLQSSTATKMALWAAASGSAEVFADVALCPFEMTKVRMQVALPGQAVGFPHKILPALREMSASSAETKFPFGSLYPLWGRQVPYTMVSTESSGIPVLRLYRRSRYQAHKCSARNRSSLLVSIKHKSLSTSRSKSNTERGRAISAKPCSSASPLPVDIGLASSVQLQRSPWTTWYP